MSKILLTKWVLLKRRHSVYHGLLKPNWICRLSEISQLIHQSRPTIRAWHKKFIEVRTVFEENIDRVRNRVPSWCASCNLRCSYRGVLNEAKRNLNIYVSFCSNFHLSVSSFASVMNFWNCKETLWTPCIIDHFSSVYLSKAIDSKRKWSTKLKIEPPR